MKKVENEQESMFNEGLYQIQRLHNLWLTANIQSRQPKTTNYMEWRWTLDAIWRELSRDAIKSYSEDFDADKFDAVLKDNPWYKKYLELDKDVDAKTSIRDKYIALTKLEMFLRSLQENLGKGSKWKNLDEDEME